MLPRHLLDLGVLLMPSLRVLLAFGTRPEAIKLAPLIHQCRQHAAIEPIVCLTGQHREMLDQVIEYFGIEADVDLALMRPGQSLAELTARCLTGLDQALLRFRPDCVVAQGDTTTVAATALTAFYRKIPFIHVEAGLRTGDLYAPWPEEMNRRLATLTAAIHCAPTEQARANLLAENVPGDTVHITGNTVIDALLWTARRERAHNDSWRQKYASLGERPLVLVTAHRRESFGHGLDEVCRAILILAAEYPEISFVFPVHPNPQARDSVQRVLGKYADANIHLLDPLPYPEFVWLMDRSTLIISDSGGVQEEAPSLGKPVLVTREVTERTEALDVGAVELVGTDAWNIVDRASLLLSDADAYAARQVGSNPYGDGHAAERIIELMLQHVTARAAAPPLRLAA